jgi:phosphatidylglycerol:prolipoprotein diacylglycerol transferase
MYPDLFHIGSLPIKSYGVMLAISFLLGLRLAQHRARRLGIEPPRMADLAIVVMVAAIVGSRLFYVLTHIDQYRGHWLDAVAFWKGLYGLSMLGGVVLAVIGGFVLMLLRRWPVWKVADAVIPSFALGIFITRIGCYLNGCCFGIPTDSWIGVCFPRGSLPAQALGWPHSIHPAQLYLSLAGLYLLLVLLWADRRPHFPGFVFSLFLGLYGATRFGAEELRHFDHAPHVMLGYSNIARRAGVTDNQLISLAMVVAGLLLGAGLLLWHRRRG